MITSTTLAQTTTLPKYSSTSSSGTTVTSKTDSSGATSYDFTAFNSDKAQNTLGQGAFLTLFLEQIKHQDPLNPMESYEFVHQLATFSQLEQAYKTNELLNTISAYQSSINTAQSLSLIGRDIKTVGDVVTVREGQATSMSYLLKEAGEVTVKVYDADGELVRTIQQGEKTVGTHAFAWDGQDDDGNSLPDGSYQVKVVATSESGLPLEVVQTIQGPVTGIRFGENGVTKLLVGTYDPATQSADNRLEVSLADVQEIINPQQSSDSDDQ